ncbi:MAG TPA: hypothetical protein VL689_13735 [Paraburkholderia sp.]|jgi:hypothetical protein|nr:hypothetical protein [Paraburkholderia sp.]
MAFILLAAIFLSSTGLLVSHAISPHKPPAAVSSTPGDSTTRESPQETPGENAVPQPRAEPQ